MASLEPGVWSSLISKDQDSERGVALVSFPLLCYLLAFDFICLSLEQDPELWDLAVKACGGQLGRKTVAVKADIFCLDKGFRFFFFFFLICIPMACGSSWARN